MYRSCTLYRSSPGNVRRLHKWYQIRVDSVLTHPHTRMTTLPHPVDHYCESDQIIDPPSKNLCKLCRSVVTICVICGRMLH